MEITKKLLMSFMTTSGKKVSISVDDPRENLTESEIKTAMTTILSKNIFKPGGENFASLVEAKVVETGTTEYDFVL
ncbi:DUF2922 domain-containing protein [Romboutsia sp. 1001216sp1]|nr:MULTISPECIES: DUF2922 domain-containing protein [unclassified Romboutsia]MDB8793034.1 DUF2922 domain-containing protein [Romboutsia sp. 1001216sp1]MDB8795163.1 DUF2922 domain-containing protein [Romboutsia sp. 1001216sp1]MDB8798972.1 DUF2922 domain-containing protein [Romboutsia sp. 1001216sp1]MDB8801777.1 DUF2922 domain-containing protein [Romboutsia sp. 1001216sp1]MDB8813174.1 DUF2922 domain-containing protein [Romboutsia sp. 1001216sp1]